jgi:hypothetical protein
MGVIGKVLRNGRVIKASNSIVLNYPKLISEWHPTKNGNKKPQNYIKGVILKIILL